MVNLAKEERKPHKCFGKSYRENFRGFERHEAILSQISKAKDQNQTNTTSKSPLSTNNADTSTAKITSPSRGILALPVVSAHKEILMPISTGFPLSSTSLEHAREIVKVCNNTSITPPPSSNVILTTAEGSVLQPCGTINMPITIRTLLSKCS